MKNTLSFLALILLTGLCLFAELQKMEPIAVSIGQNDTEMSASALAGIGLLLGVLALVYIFRPEKVEQEGA